MAHHLAGKNVLSRVPNGTVLGPHLFLLFINDISETVSSSNLRLFADDCLVCRTIKTSEDEVKLQEDLDNLVNWTETWGMRFNAAKCKSCVWQTAETKRNATTKWWVQLLIQQKHCQYLGINIQDNLKWKMQSQHAASKASRVLGFICRNFHHASTNIKEKLYRTLVRPHLEYGIAAWDLYHTKDINVLERVQCRAARFVTNNYSYDASVSEMLKTLLWSSLQERRRAHRLTCLYKIHHNELDILKTYIKPKMDRSRWGHDQQIQLYNTNLDLFTNSFFPQTIKDWNKLPQSTINQATKTSFKQSILSLIL